MKLRVLVMMLLASLLLVSCADPITEIQSGLTQDALDKLGLEVGAQWENRASTNIVQSIDGNSDSRDIADPVVIKEGTTYKMWYSGMGVDDKWRVLYATSKDGKTWNKDAEKNPVLIPSDKTNNSSAEDRDGTKLLGVVYDSDENRYKMWYIGYFKTSNNTTGVEKTYSQIFYARAPTEDSGWVKHPMTPENPGGKPEPVLSLLKRESNGKIIDAESYNIDSGTVMREVFSNGYVNNPFYKLWFSYVEQNSSLTLMNSFSFDGTSWFLQDFPSISPAQLFYVNGIKSPTVIRDYIGNVYAYKMWYTGKEAEKFAIGYAVSETDGVYFNNYAVDIAPVLQSGDPGEEKNIYDPCVIRDGNKYIMWYIGQNELNLRKTLFYRESLSYK